MLNGLFAFGFFFLREGVVCFTESCKKEIKESLLDWNELLGSAYIFFYQKDHNMFMTKMYIVISFNKYKNFFFYQYQWTQKFVWWKSQCISTMMNDIIIIYHRVYMTILWLLSFIFLVELQPPELFTLSLNIDAYLPSDFDI